MEIEIPLTLQELKLWPDTLDAAMQLSDACGKKALISIVYPQGSRAVFHEDGVYEIANLRISNNGSTYIAEVLNDDGTERRVGFSLEGLAGVLVSCSNGDCLRLEEHPGRFRRVKINGDFSIPVEKVLASQVGKLVLMDSSENPNSFGRYFPINVDETTGNAYRATVSSSIVKDQNFSSENFGFPEYSQGALCGNLSVLDYKGATTGTYDYKKVRGILVAERNLPPEFVRRPY